MKKVAIVVFALFFLFLMFGCGPKQKVEQPPPAPPVEQPKPQEQPKPVEPTPEQPQPEKKVLSFRPIYFEFDKYRLLDESKNMLNETANLLKENSTAKIRIEGNCDERGTVEYNLALGEKRAKVAKDYLVGLGIDAERITIISYGKEKPLDPGHDESAWSKNRRDDFVGTTE
jgi:peptidoglycan-associated lipoprotein